MKRKLKQGEIEAIKYLYQLGMPLAKIGKAYGISGAKVWAVAHGYLGSHLDDENQDCEGDKS